MTKLQLKLIGLFVGVALIALASPATAAFRVTVTQADGFDPSSLRKVAIVATECDPVVDCNELTRRAVGEATEMNLPMTVVPEVVIRNLLFDNGATKYSIDHRVLIADHLELDALIEIRVPHAEKGSGLGGRSKSRVTVELDLIRPTGQILLHAVGTGRPNNVVSSPERAAGTVIEKILREAF